MMGNKTIIQPIGPLYGEAVNGTVYGRPNGSIYIPDNNSIVFENKSELLYIANMPSWGNPLYIAFTDGGLVNHLYADIVAKSQDNAAYIVVEVASSSDFSGTLATRVAPAGAFNLNYGLIATGLSIVDGSTYYVRARLVAATGVDVAVTDTLTVTGVA